MKIFLLLTLLPAMVFSQSSKVSFKKKYFWFEMGDSLSKSNNHQDAVVAFSRSISYREDTVDAYYQRAFEYVEMKNFRAAISDFNTYLRQVKGQEYTRDNLLPIDERKGFTLDQVMLSHHMLGLCYIRFDDVEKACDHFTLAGQLGHNGSNEMIKKYCN